MNLHEWHAEALGSLLNKRSTLPHALLISGARGIGKLAFVRALAQAMLCVSVGDGEPACGTCSACAWFDTAGHPDYRQVEPSAESLNTEAVESEKTEKKEKKSIIISIDQIRALSELIALSSHQGGAKVIVIHPVEMMNVNAANALLKNLEEPPSRTYFLLVTHRPQQVLPTIKSRCRHVTLRAPSPSVAQAWLKSQGVSEPALALAQAGGAPLLALELDNPEHWRTRAAFLRELSAGDLQPIAAAESLRDIPIPQAVSWLQKWSYDLVY
ncbi:MAG: DNA polymerase III subunit delta', partial [Pseudomonadota bacterium]